MHCQYWLLKLGDGYIWFHYILYFYVYLNISIIKKLKINALQKESVEIDHIVIILGVRGVEFEIFGE